MSSLKNEPMVSVLMTVYNREKFIADAIESVMASTYQSWELIIVDDQSKDSSVAIAKSFAQKDPRIQVHVNTENLGDYPNRNKAASFANGKYLKYVDADDMIYPHGLEIMVNSMERFPEAILGISQEVEEDYRPFPFVLDPETTIVREYLKRGVLGVGPTATIIRKDMFNALNGFSGTRFIGDMELWYKMALYHKIVKIVPGLVFWRRHEGQEFNLGMSSNFYLENTFLLKHKFLSDKSLKITSSNRQKALDILKRNYLRKLLRLCMYNKKPIEAFKLFNSCNLKFTDLLLLSKRYK